jgi:regulator of sigma E protease
MTNIENGFQYNEQAHSIGFRDGDIPISADGKEIAEFSLGPVMRTISNASTVTVLRQGEEIELKMPEEGLSMLKMLQSQPPFLTLLAEAYIDSVMPGSAADKAGIEKGMRLVAAGGKDISTWADFDYEVTLRRQDVLSSPDCTAADSLKWRTLDCVVASADMSKMDTLSLLLDEQYLMGVTRQVPDYKTVHLDYNILSCIPAGLDYGWRVLKSYVSDLKYVASADGAKSVGSFITIGSIFPSAWDWQQFWLLTAFISIILAVMNILPIPGLDGGHIVLLFYEGITGRQPSDKVMEWIEKIGIGIIIALMLLAFSNDIRNFILPLFGL